MIRTAQALLLGCLAFSTLPSWADNSLLIPASSRCVLDVPSEELQAALTVCQQAAINGDTQAQFELGEYYYLGKHTPRDLAQALGWFEKASLQGHAQAQYRLGSMFFRGEGVPANNVQAFIILKMASVNGSDDALDSADLVTEQMRREELDIASQVLGQIFRSYLLQIREERQDAPFDLND